MCASSKGTPTAIAEQAPWAETFSGALEGERKTLSVLFADIKGSMELIEDLDPEEASAIVDPAVQLMIEAVRHYGGYVAQSTGDGIFALFGAPVAHEDHPQRALLSALRMQEAVKRHAEKLRAEKGVNLQVRVGVNSGEVVVREIRTGEAHREYAPIGHATSLAARLQALATPGSIAISEAVRKLGEGYFSFKPLGPVRVKGVSEPIEIYEVAGLGPLRSRLQRAAARGYTKFVGRQREMEAIKRAAQLAKQGRGQIVATVAEPGVGKSRLLLEFKSQNRSSWTVLESVTQSPGKPSALLPVIGLLDSYFDLKPEDDMRKRREKIAGRVLALDPSLANALADLFGLLGLNEAERSVAETQAKPLLQSLSMFGLTEADTPVAEIQPQIHSRRALDVVKRILLRESLNQPLILIFEDLHWIDNESQDFLDLLADSISNARILLLVTYRPEYGHEWRGKTFFTQVKLEPLGQKSADEMLTNLLGEGKDLTRLKRLVIRKTQGNPLFIEEIVLAMFEEGALVGKWGGQDQSRAEPFHNPDYSAGYSGFAN